MVLLAVAAGSHPSLSSAQSVQLQYNDDSNSNLRAQLVQSVEALRVSRVTYQHHQDPGQGEIPEGEALQENWFVVLVFS